MKDYLDIGGFIKGTLAVTLQRLNEQYERICCPTATDPPRITRESVSDHPHLREAVLGLPAFLVEHREPPNAHFSPYKAYHMRSAALDGVLAWIDTRRDVSNHKVRQTLRYADTCTTRDGTDVRIRASTTGELIDEARTLQLPQEPEPEIWW
jgi:hypothetical protein